MSDCIRSCGRKARQGSKVCVQCAERTYQRDDENGRVQRRRELRPTEPGAMRLKRDTAQRILLLIAALLLAFQIALLVIEF